MSPDRESPDAADHEEAVEMALAKLDLPTKVSILAGRDMWSLPAVPEIGLAPLVMSDGPVGVRGTGWAPDDPSIALPSPTALAATWDVGLARSAGVACSARRLAARVCTCCSLPRSTYTAARWAAGTSSATRRTRC